ncbi:FliC/FljB family flagellin [Halomonas sp.]|uniref:FliC/FljB family flagellin n=1 Tax=Halomonas sp. TaxID=1486246 RepID=UPI000C698F78|nr:FliC/FljB family flagellin [Halomonas sp.]MAY71230.1 flagellin FliC [Halomonas sp.]MCJ8285062.1 FliC/FljB family flagellin [Halomonas sp.]NQY70112.1 FliC/FljB family flagellin [Halomonas sp.]
MSVINTNITSMIGQQNLNASKSALTTSMERLSSGLRINSAKDDAAGQAIANRMSATVTGLNQASRNANDGISLAQTAEGALNQINDNLQRVRELTVQAENGTNSQSDLDSIQDEISARLSEIDRVSAQTDFNGTKVLNGDKSISIQVGSEDGQSISIDLKDVSVSALKLGGFNVNSSVKVEADLSGLATGGAGTDADPKDTLVSYKDSSGNTAYAVKTEDTTNGTTYTSALIDSTDGAVTKGSALSTAPTGATEVTDGTSVRSNRTTVDTSGLAVPASSLQSYTADDGSTQYAVEVGTGKYQNAEIDASTGKVTIGDNDISAAVTAAGDAAAVADDTQIETSGTVNPLSQLDSAIKDIDNFRSDLGAVQNRFDSAIENLSTTTTNLSSARSRIEDADYAVEVANMTRAQILQQAGTSVLAQANQVPQSVLSLLG